MQEQITGQFALVVSYYKFIAEITNSIRILLELDLNRNSSCYGMNLKNQNIN